MSVYEFIVSRMLIGHQKMTKKSFKATVYSCGEMHSCRCMKNIVIAAALTDVDIANLCNRSFDMEIYRLNGCRWISP